MSKSSLTASKAEYQGVIEEQNQGSETVDASLEAPVAIASAGVGNCGRLSPELARTWLAWQCRMVAGIINGGVYLPTEVVNKGPAIAAWPNEGDVKPLPQSVDIATQALTEGRGVMRSLQRYGPDNQSVCDLIACPLLVGGVPVAIVSVMISPRSEAQQQAVLQLLQWGGLWIDSVVKQQLFTQQDAGAMTAMTAMLQHSSTLAAAMEAANQLADQLQCERVSIGFRHGLSIRLQALSHVASFDPRSELVRRIEAAMEEAVDQNISVIHPDNEKAPSDVNRAHAQLVGGVDGKAIYTIPLSGVFGTIGAITLERGNSQAFDKSTRQICEALVRLIGPALELKQREQRGFWALGLDALRTSTKKLLGLEYLKAKVITLSMLLLLAALSFIEGRYEVTAQASIEGAVRQTLVAPYSGYVKQAEVRAGELVKKGQFIASLDDSYLQLDYQKWQGESNKVEKQYQEALAKRERVNLGVLRAQLDQVKAELSLIEAKIKRSQLHAPFDGVVVSGDLSQSLGAPVDIGQVLYAVAPLQSYRVVLEVDEHDVAGLDKGKSGKLIISALPQMSFSVTVDQVVPVAVSSGKRNFFRVEASLDEQVSVLRPGMQGVAKVEMGRRSLLWILCHTMVDRIRLWAWSVGW